MKAKSQLLLLLKKEAFLKQRVKLASGKVSNFYIDVRKVSLNPQGSYLISQLIFNLIKKEKINAFGGPTLGADPIVSAVLFLAYQNKKRLKGFLIRKFPKKHGRQKLIEGQKLIAGDKAIIVDDVATSGSSLVRAIDILKKQKIKVIKAVCVVDRQEGAKENLAEFNCPLVSLFNKSDFL